MTTIDWALQNEQAVAPGAPMLADVINRPLREVLTLSGADPDASFVGFSLVGHTHVVTADDVSAGTFPAGTYVFCGAVDGITAMALGANASGTDAAAADVTLAAPVSTGTGTPSTLHIQTTHIDSSGSTSQTLEDVLTLTDRAAIFPRGIVVTGAPGMVGDGTGLAPSFIYCSTDVGLVLTPGAARYADFILENSVDPLNPGTNPYDAKYTNTLVMIGWLGAIDVGFFGQVFAQGKVSALGFNVGGWHGDVHSGARAGTDGVDFDGPIHNLTVMKGIVTAAS
ncbi:MAG: hypothetical protein ABI442_19140 [Gemmatimonadaceae bacterium]